MDRRSTGLFLLIFLCGQATMYFFFGLHLRPDSGKCVQHSQLLGQLAQLRSVLHKESVSASVTEKLDKITELLKNTQNLSAAAASRAEENSAKQSDDTKLLEVCPETWWGRGDNLYYLDSWRTLNCPNVLPFPTVLSVVLYPSPQNGVGLTCHDQIHPILSGLSEQHQGVRVIVANVDDYCQLNTTSPHVQFVSIDSKVKGPGEVWNHLIRKVDTKYVLVGRDMDNFMWFTDLKRPVRVLSNIKTIKIVGGAVRNKTGHWRLGCHQTTLRNYILEYQAGYYKSMNECMFCDYLTGPFVARTDFLKKQPFNESLPRELLFEDFFLMVQQLKQRVVNCPDVMFFASDPTLDAKSSEKELWLPIVRKWELNRILVANRVFAYSCEESGLTCHIQSGLIESYLMPICCIEQFAKAAFVLHEFCFRHNIQYEFAGGTLMGIIKTGDLLPWDHDGDCFYRGNYSIFKDYEEEFTENGVEMGKLQAIVKTEYRWSYYTPDIEMDMSGCTGMSFDRLKDKLFERVPTLAQLHGNWVRVMPNPGLYNRNNYGHEVLKHAHHWKSLGLKFHEPYTGGHFKKCLNPKHHACLDHFSADGSLQFRIPN